MNHAKALRLAAALVEHMRPFCERIEIAGSIRRNQAEVKDIELVVMPRWEDRQVTVGLFGETETRSINHLFRWAISPDAESVLTWIKPATSEVIPWAPKQDARYWRGILLTERIKVDVFLCTPENWGATFLLRTGSREFMTAIASRAKAIGRNMMDGSYTIAGVPVMTREEADVFRLLRVKPVKPELRRDGRDVIIVPSRGL